MLNKEELSEHEQSVTLLRDFFKKRVQEHGLSYQSVWGDVNAWKALERFKVIEEGDLEEGQKVVDLGCGTGLLKSYLDLINKSIKYVGVDVVPEFIQHVQSLPGAEALNVDFYNKLESVPSADWYAIFGSINKRWMVGLEDSDSLNPVYDWIESAFKKANKGIFINGFTDRADKPKIENVHLNPLKVLEKLGTSFKSYRIRHDNPFYEFTLMVSK